MKRITQFILITSILSTCNLQIGNAQITKLLDINGLSTGSYPLGSLVSDGNYLYGVTPSGGANNFGTVFRIKPDGSNASIIYNFNGDPDGKYPNSGLFFDGTFLYGTTDNGGVSFRGTVFKLKTDGTGYSKLVDFIGSNGTRPNSVMVFDGTFLYGSTDVGGSFNSGTIFKVQTDGSNFTTLYEFTGSSYGSRPTGVILDGTTLYGNTYDGGSSGYGEVFKINTDGSGFSIIRSFGIIPDGHQPESKLLFDGTYLYGTTWSGGSHLDGTIFRLKPDGSNYSNIFNFISYSSGSYCFSSLISDSNYLYGVTSAGGLFGQGTAFRIKTDGTLYQNLNDFKDSLTGTTPSGPLYFDGNYLYGVTGGGGTNSLGVIYKLCSPPAISITVSEDTVCLGAEVTLTASGPDSIVWSNGIFNGIAFLPIVTNTYTVTGTVAATGCTSNSSLTIIVDSVITSVSQDSISLTSNQGGATYQWVDCNNGFIPIMNETNQTFFPHTIGSYAVMVTTNTCSDTSQCYYVAEVGIDEFQSINNFVLYPNPTNEILNIKTTNLIKNSTIKIINTFGQIVFSEILIDLTPEEVKHISVQGFKKGVYSVILESESKFISHQTFIIN